MQQFAWLSNEYKNSTNYSNVSLSNDLFAYEKDNPVPKSVWPCNYTNTTRRLSELYQQGMVEILLMVTCILPIRNVTQSGRENAPTRISDIARLITNELVIVFNLLLTALKAKQTRLFPIRIVAMSNASMTNSK